MKQKTIREKIDMNRFYGNIKDDHIFDDWFIDTCYNCSFSLYKKVNRIVNGIFLSEKIKSVFLFGLILLVLPVFITATSHMLAQSGMFAIAQAAFIGVASACKIASSLLLKKTEKISYQANLIAENVDKVVLQYHGTRSKYFLNERFEELKSIKYIKNSEIAKEYKLWFDIQKKQDESAEQNLFINTLKALDPKKVLNSDKTFFNGTEENNINNKEK